MTEISRILCPVDFSDHSRHALDHAAAIARWYESRITALHAIPPVTTMVPTVGAPLYPPIVFTAEDLEQYRGAVQEFAREITAAGVPVDAVAVEGGAARTIVEWAQALPADLIVLGTHGRSGFERLMLGSVTERVLRKAPCPVLTVPPRAPDVPPDRPVVYKRILCPIDFSPSSIRALEYASSLAVEADADLTVMHVLETGAPALQPVPSAGAERQAEKAAHEAASRRLHEVIAEQVRAFSHVHERVAAGKPYREVIQTASREQHDLIVMGVHGGVAGALAFGSTTNNVMREAPCPVLTLRG
jgi:nucleotide-binding universal stress UspA family protein